MRDSDKQGYGLFGFEVRAMRPVADAVFELVLECPEAASRIEPGQFVNIAVPGDHSHLLRIPLSYASADAAAGTIQIVFAVVGEGTRRLSAMKAGERSTLVGPLGHGWRLPGPDREGPALLVSGGVGLPPVVAAAAMLAPEASGLVAVVGAQSASRLWQGGARMLEELGAEVHVTTDDGTLGTKGFTTDVAARLLKERSFGSAYACGPAPMEAGLARLCKEAGVPLQASLERMMTCGFGACNTCNVALAGGGYASCCKDGPVFDAEEVAW